MQRYGNNGKTDGGNQIESWLEEHPWIRHSRSGSKEANQHSSLNNEIMESKGIIYPRYYVWYSDL